MKTCQSKPDFKHPLEHSLKQLFLPTVRAYYEEAADQARANSQTYEMYLFELMQREVEARKQNRINRCIRASKLPLEKNIATFDRQRLPQNINMQLASLLEGSFLDRCENLLVFGNPGSGKTHILCAIAQELIYKGKQIKFYTCNLLVQELLIAKRDLKLARKLKQLAKFDALLIDDIGYVKQSREEMEVLFTLLADRYERSSIMLTSNLPFSKWEHIFKDPMTTAAAIDRLVHHCIILELNLDSYRLQQAQKKNQMTTN